MIYDIFMWLDYTFSVIFDIISLSVVYLNKANNRRAPIEGHPNPRVPTIR